MGKRLVERKREQDGRFALLLESESAVQNSLRQEALKRQRQQIVAADNAEWAAANNVNLNELDMLFM